MALPSFTQHLSVLERAGLVTSTKTGRVRTYELVPAALDVADGWWPSSAACGNAGSTSSTTSSTPSPPNPSNEMEHR